MSIKTIVKKTFQKLSGKTYDPFAVLKKEIESKVIEKEFLEIYHLCKDYTMTSPERMYSLYKATRYVIEAKIPGDFVECGVWKGGSAMIIAATLKQIGVTNRYIYLYDTFEGMSEPTEYDVKNVPGGGASIRDYWEQNQKNDVNEWCYSSLGEVSDNLQKTGYPNNMFKLTKGKVEDTIPGVKPEIIALLRLDTDWYESTKHELDNLYPNLQDKGVLIIDDYGSWAGAKKAVDEYFLSIPILFNRVDTTGRIAIKV
jgi:O-methyltransferase